MAREFYSNEEKAEHIARWKASGMSRKDYAAGNGINKETFYKWLQRKQNYSSENQQKGFVEIKQTRAFRADVIKIRKAGMEMEIPPEFFEKVVKVLAAI